RPRALESRRVLQPGCGPPAEGPRRGGDRPLPGGAALETRVPEPAQQPRARAARDRRRRRGRRGARAGGPAPPRRGRALQPGARRAGGGRMRGGWGAGLALVVAAGLGAAEEGRPRIALDEPVFDFGTVDRGARVDHTFRVPNRSGATLRIDHVKSSCGCTVAVLSEREVPPGGEARVALSLDTARLAGRTTKTVNVYTND